METFELAVDSLRARQCIKWTRYDADVLPAWVADMDFAVAEPVQRAIGRLVEQQDYGYPERTGPDGLESAFAGRMLDRFGWDVDSEQVRPVADLVQAVTASILAFSEPGATTVVTFHTLAPSQCQTRPSEVVP